MTADDASSIAPEIAAYYARGGEANRLFRDHGQLELARTQEILLRHMPAQPSTVIDVGGGTGVYAHWLAGLGHQVHLVDPVASHVQAALQGCERFPSSQLAGATIGDACQLEFRDATADVVLLLGPLYHLTDRAQRIRSLQEARRVLRPGGLLFAVGITRYAPLLGGLFLGLLNDPEFVPIVERVLRTGEHADPKQLGYFTTAYMHHPDELEREIVAAGFEVEEFVSIEGIAACLPDFDKWWDDSGRREWLLDVTRLIEHDRTLFGASNHLMIVGRKPGRNP